MEVSGDPLLDVVGFAEVRNRENVGHERVFDGVVCVKVTAWRLILDVSVWFSKLEILVKTNSPKKKCRLSHQKISFLSFDGT